MGLEVEVQKSVASGRTRYVCDFEEHVTCMSMCRCGPRGGVE